jgi:hypothetical protein
MTFWSSTSAVTVFMSMLWGWDTFVVLLFVELRSPALKACAVYRP